MSHVTFQNHSGQMFRNGWDNSVRDADAVAVLAMASAARTADAGNHGARGEAFPLAPLREEDAPNAELREAWEYYHTPRCAHPNAPGFMTKRLHVVAGASHMSLYDVPGHVDEAVSQLAPFFQSKL